MVLMRFLPFDRNRQPKTKTCANHPPDRTCCRCCHRAEHPPDYRSCTIRDYHLSRSSPSFLMWCVGVEGRFWGDRGWANRRRNLYVKCSMRMRNYLNSHPMPNHMLLLQGAFTDLAWRIDIRSGIGTRLEM